MRSSPPGVRGPVDFPPCNLQRPFLIAGAWQGVPRRFLAPHRGALLKSPGGLPFFSHPRRLSWGCASTLAVISPPSLVVHRPHNGLAALVDMDVLNRDFLLSALAPVLLQGFHLGREGLQQPYSLVNVFLPCFQGYTSPHPLL
jgi:hypothetical protein